MAKAGEFTKWIPRYESLKRINSLKSQFSYLNQTPWMKTQSYSKINKYIKLRNPEGQVKALSTMIQYMYKQLPYSRKITHDKDGIPIINLDPLWFKQWQNQSTLASKIANAPALTGGWIDKPDQDPHEPYIRINANIFRDPQYMGRVLHHEICHLPQRRLPGLYRGDWLDNKNRFDGWNLREFEAHLRGLEMRNGPGPLQLNPLQKWDTMRVIDLYSQRARQEQHWKRLEGNPKTNLFLDRLINRWNDSKQATWHEIEGILFNSVRS
jgi:hypothetical protein